MSRPARIPLRNFRRLPIPAAVARSFAASAAYVLLPGLAAANPTGGAVVAGQASITQTSANHTVIDETSKSAVINWQQFDIGPNQYVQFVQPSASSVVLNRIIGGSPSEIFGSLTANGRVFLVNPSGILFAPGAQLDVGSLFASTLNISNNDFMAGHYVFAAGGQSNASVVNAGTIDAANGGFVVLAGATVNNAGVVQAQLGQVVLASGALMTMGLDDSGLVSFAVNQATLAQKAGVANAGELLADGGRVLMAADTARDLVGAAVNNTGLVRAHGIAQHGGDIELVAAGGGTIETGTLDASSTSGAGGTIVVAGQAEVDVGADSQILASGATHGGRVQIVSDGKLAVQAGAEIEALGGTGQGGIVELSGHGTMTFRGNVDLGKGGTLSLDPTNLTIGAGSGTSSSATVYQNFVQGELQAGTNVNLVATNSITLSNLGTGGVLNGVNPTGGASGNLLLGIGTMPNGTYIEGPSGTISFQNTSNSIVVGGKLTIDAGSTGGTVAVGNLTGSAVNVKGVGGISVGNVSATNGSIVLAAASGAITGGSLNASASGINTAENASITVNAGGAVDIGAVTASARNQSSYGGTAANAAVAINADVANLGGGLTVGNISATASAFNGSANASIALSNLNSGIQVGTLTAGSVLSSASGTGKVNGSVTLLNDNGAITTQSISTSVSAFSGTVAATPNGAVNVTATNGAVSLGSVLSSQGGITVAATGGNLVTGSLTAYGGNVALTANTGSITTGMVYVSSEVFGTSAGASANVTMLANNGITVDGAITTSAISNVDPVGVSESAAIDLEAGHFGGAGNLTIGGPISATAECINCASLAIASVTLVAANGGISLVNSDSVPQSITTFASGRGSTDAHVLVQGTGGVQVGAVTATASGSGNANASVSLVAGGSNLAVGGAIKTLAVGGTAGSADASVSLSNTAGNISAGSNAISTSASGSTTQANITLAASGGNITAGSLSADNGAITASTTGSGSITLGALSGGSSGGSLKSVTVAAGGGLSIGGTQITASSITLSAGSGNFSFGGGKGNLTATNGSVSVTVANGSLSLGSVSATNGTVLLDAGFTGNAQTGVMTDGTASLTVGNITSTSNSSDAVVLQAGNNVSAGNITANGLHVLAVNGNLAVGNLQIGTGDFTLLDSASAAGSYTFTTGNISCQSPTFCVSLFTTNPTDVLFTYTFGNINAPSVSMQFVGNENVHVGNITSAGSVDLSTGTGTLSFGNINASAIDISTGSGLSFSGVTLDSSGALTLAVSGGALGITSSKLYGQTVNVSGSSSLSLTGTTVAGGSDTAAGSITLASSGGGMTLATSTLNSTGSTAISAGGVTSLSGTNINSGGLNLGGAGGLSLTGSTLTGTAVTLSSTGGAVSLSSSTLNGSTLVIDAAGNISTSADSGLLSTSTVTLDSSGGTVTVGADLSAPGTISITGTGVTTAGLTGSSIDAVATSGTLATGAISSGGNVTLSAPNGPIQVGGTLTFGTSASGALQITGTAVTTQDIVDNSPLIVAGTSNDLFLTSTNGNIQTGNISTAGTSTEYLNLSATGGTITTGNLTVEGISAGATGDITLGNLVLQSLTPGAAGTSNITSSGGNVTFGTVSSNHGLDASAAAGTLTTGAIAVNGALTLSGIAVSSQGQSLSGSGVSVNSTTGALGVGSITSAGNVALTSTTGPMSFGNISGEGISITTGTNLAFTGLTLQSAGPLSLNVTGQLTISNSSLFGQDVSASGTAGLSLTSSTVAGPNDTAASSITLTSSGGTVTVSSGTLTGAASSISGASGVTLSADTIGGASDTPAQSITVNSANGALALSSSSIFASGIAATAANGITVTNSTLSNGLLGSIAHGPTGRGLRPNVAGPGISLNSTGDISFSSSSIDGTQISISGANLHLTNHTTMVGSGAVSLTATGTLDASGTTASSINAGALSATANVIDLSDAVLTIGTGTASFGSDPGMLSALNKKAPGLLPLGGIDAGPNAAFSAAGGVTLGQISLAGGYLFVQAPSLQLPAPTGAANIFVNYLPTTPSAVLNFSPTAPPSSITTLVIGGTPQTGNILIGNGHQTFALNTNTNLVFDSQGKTFYPDSISSNAQVVVLGAEILQNPPPTNNVFDINGLPLTPGDYNNDQPGEGVLGYPGDPGSVNSDGVTLANLGFIDIQTSQQQQLSCGLGGN